jgi:hypothetical protein
MEISDNPILLRHIGSISPCFHYFFPEAYYPVECPTHMSRTLDLPGMEDTIQQDVVILASCAWFSVNSLEYLDYYCMK